VGEVGKNLTIGGFELQEVGNDQEREQKYVVIWQQADYKPLVLNKENANRLKVICKTDDTDAMIGTTVNVYNDPMVSFGGKITGGIRVRPSSARPQQKPAPRPAAKPAQEDPDDELPPIEAYDDTAPF
jgi:hypothetical protein